MNSLIMENISQQQGRAGELFAKKHLINSGYEILEQNWRYKKFEIDLIAKKGQTIVFAEVKTRKSNTFGEPEMFVNRQKQGFLVAAANQYLKEKEICLESRFDIIAVTEHQQAFKLKHLEAAFYPLIK